MAQRGTHNHSAPEEKRLRHSAFLYRDLAEYAECAVPFLTDGLESGDSVLAVAPRDRLAVVRHALGDASESVTFIDANSVYTRPARALASYAQTVRHRMRTNPAVRAVAELPVGPSKHDWDEWAAYEALVNTALAPLPLWVVCTYNEREAPEEMIDAMWRTHARMGFDEWDDSPDFETPEDILRAAQRHPRPLPQLRSVSPGADPESFRERIGEELRAEEVPDLRAIDMIVAANEVAENAWKHGDGAEELRVGRVHGRFVCEVVDRGGGFDDPFAGYIPPEPASKPAGLFVARQLTWKLEQFGSERGHTVRLWL